LIVVQSPCRIVERSIIKVAEVLISVEQLSVIEAIVKVVEEIREFVREIASKLSTGGNLIATLERFCQSARVGCKLNRKKKPGNLSLLRDPECLDYVLS